MTKKNILLLLVWMLGMSMAFGQMEEKTVEKRIESEHPYANGVKRGEAGYSWTIAPARAQEMRVFFEYIDTEDGYDHVELRTDEVKKRFRFTGEHEKVWSDWLAGSELRIELTSDGSKNGKGFVASRYQYRYVAEKKERAVVEGKLWAVVIGISEYKYQSVFPALPAAKKDAEKLYEFLVAPEGGGVDKSQVKYLPDAQLVDILQAKNWLQARVGKEDRVLFFYAGHGEIDEKKKAYLVPKEGYADYEVEGELAETVVGVPLEKLREDLWELPAQQVAMILDSCYSGTVISSKGEGLQTRAGVRERKKDLEIDLGPPPGDDKVGVFAKKELAEGKERIIITSCEADEKAIELADYGQGAFTYYLLQGIRGSALADSDGDKRVAIEEAFRYLKEEVSDLAKRYRHEQTPQMKSWGKGLTPYYLKLKAEDRPLQLWINEPERLREEDYLKVSSREIRIAGTVRFGPGVREIYVDNKLAQWHESDGKRVFEGRVELDPGKDKSFRIKVVDVNGREYRRDVTVYSTYEAKPEFRLLDVVAVDKNGKEKKRFGSDERVYLLFRWQISEAAGASKQELQAWGKGVEKVTQSGRIKEGAFSHRVPLEVTGKGRLAVKVAVQIEEQRKEKEVYFLVKDNDDRYEENDSRESAREILPGNYSGLKIVSGDEDWFRLEVKETSEVRIDANFRHNRGDLDMSLWQGDKKLAKSTSSNDDETIEMKKLLAGRYDLQVYGYENAANEYDLVILQQAKKGPEKWSEKLWQACWKSKEEYVDFTASEWMELSAREQRKLAGEYQRWYAKEKGVAVEQTYRAKGAEFVMRLVPPGKYWMGSPKSEAGRDDDEKRHEVLISKAFWLSKTEVTQQQWQEVMGEENPSHFKNAGMDAPVEEVSWDDCQKFCEKVEGGLPSEAQWEYACRAGVYGMSYVGDFEIRGEHNAPKLGEIAWYGGNSGVSYSGGWDSSGWSEMQHRAEKSGTKPVGKKPANGYGLHDMLGNVWEWCQDGYKENYDTSQVRDPVVDIAGTEKSVLRGGSWGSYARRCRCANRGWSWRSRRYAYDGLRLFRSFP